MSIRIAGELVKMAFAEAIQAVEELDCLYVNGDRYPFGGIPADEFSGVRRVALQEAIAAIRAVSEGENPCEIHDAEGLPILAAITAGEGGEK